MSARWFCYDCKTWHPYDVERCPCEDEPDPNPHHIPDTLEEMRGER